MLSVRELTAADVELIINYWLNADKEYLLGMGALIEKIPPRDYWVTMLHQQLAQEYTEKQSYAIIWLEDGEPIGHCNVNNIEYGEQAHMHLHIWNTNGRQKGMGSILVQMTLPYFFSNLQLKRLLCEPYALNAAPNKTLEKVGFELKKEYVTTPGYLNFEQPVRLWEMSLQRFNMLQDQGL